MKYLDPKNDLVFKRIFGENPNILKSFLNAILPLGEQEQIVTLEYLTNEQIPELTILKNSIVDVKCIDKNGRIFIVEMQMNWSVAFQQRVLFNVSKAFVRQLEKSKKYELLHPVYGLSLINDIFDKKTDDYYHHFKLVNVENSQETIEGLQLVFVELPKFTKNNYLKKKIITLWLRFLKEIDEKTTEVDVELLNVPEIESAVHICETQAYSPLQLEWYDKFWDVVRVEKTFISDSFNAGKNKGLEEAMDKMVESGMSQDQAKKILGLS